MTDEVPQDLKTFIFQSFESVNELRIFLLLRNKPDEELGPVQVSAALYLTLEQAAAGLSGLEERGFLALNGALYQFRPATPGLEKMANEVAKLDQERPVTLINLIYSRPKDRLQAFASAFNLRKGD